MELEKVISEDRSITKDGKRPTPFVLTIVATGATHAAYFRNKVNGQVAFNGLISARRAFIDKAADKLDFQEDFVLDDDAGTRYLIALKEFRSAQLADVVGEHWANADRKLLEAYVAVDFQAHVQKHHAGLTILRAAPSPGGSVIRPGN